MSEGRYTFCCRCGVVREGGGWNLCLKSCVSAKMCIGYGCTLFGENLDGVYFYGMMDCTCFIAEIFQYLWE